MRLGTRGSALALAQAGLVRERLEALGEQVKLVEIATSGDERAGAAPTADKSRFVKEIEAALLRDEIDLAVHSAKDVPGELPAGLAIVGVPERADPRDALCGAGSVGELAEGAAVGTASLRRRSQLLAARPDLDVRELRGNVDTRLRKLAQGECDALVLAVAGLERLARSAEGHAIPAGDVTPAAGQGCLALEGRAGDERATQLGSALTHRPSLLALTAERAFLTGIGADCDTPVGAHARIEPDALRMDVYVGLADGSEWLRDSFAGDAEDPSGLGTRMAQRTLSAGAAGLLAGA